MSWRVVADGPMLDEVLDVRNGVEVTSTRIYREGETIKGELSKSLVERYDAEDPYVRSIVERVKIEVDDEGNKVVTPIGKPESDPVDPDVLKRAEDAETEVTDLRTKVSDLEGELETAKVEADAAAAQSNGEVEELKAKVEELNGQLEEATAAPGAVEEIPYEKLSPEALTAEAEKRGLEVEGTGANGNVLKTDLVGALKESDKA